MQRFIQFNDENVNSFQLMELIDLAKTLTKSEKMDVQYGPLNYFDYPNQQIVVSHFWDHRSKEEEWLGLKSDIFLRAIGTYQYSNVKNINIFLRSISKSSISSFGKQLFMMIEDARIEEKIKRTRPGTKRAFTMRRSLYRRFFQSQLNVHTVKGVHTDALFNFLYILIHAQAPIMEWPEIHPKINQARPFILQQIQKAYEVNSTHQSAKLAIELCEVLEELLTKDMLNEYFHLPEKTMIKWEEELTFKDLKRKDPLANDDKSCINLR